MWWWGLWRWLAASFCLPASPTTTTMRRRRMTTTWTPPATYRGRWATFVPAPDALRETLDRWKPTDSVGGKTTVPGAACSAVIPNRAAASAAASRQRLVLALCSRTVTTPGPLKINVYFHLISNFFIQFFILFLIYFQIFIHFFINF